MTRVSEKRGGSVLLAVAALAIVSGLLALGGPLLAASVCLVFVAFALPGFALLGPPPSVIAFSVRAVVGLAISSLALVAMGLLGVRLTAYAGVCVPLAVAGGLLFARRFRGRSLQALSSEATAETSVETPRDRLALGVVLLALLALVLPALLGVGRLVDGAHRYVPFFCADLFKHAAYVGAVAGGALPPSDPFSAGAPLVYYWLSFLGPAAALELAGEGFRAIDALRVQILLEGALLVVLLYGACRRAGAPALAATLAVVIGIAAPSLDGVTALISSPWLPYRSLVQSTNMEALDLTDFFGAPSHFAASTLYRLCLYVPQHQLALVALLAWFSLLDEPQSRLRSLASVPLLVALPMLSLLLALPAFAAVAFVRVARCLSARGRERNLARTALLVDLVGFGVAAGVVFLCGAVAPPGELNATRDLPASGAGSPLRFAWFPLQLLTSFGGVGLWGALGAWLAWRRRAPWFARVTPAALFAGGGALLVLAEILLPDSDLRVNLELKASFVVASGAVLGSALTLASIGTLGRAGRWCAFAGGLLVVLGVPGIVHDQLFHSSYFWTPHARARAHVAVPQADLAALDWVRRETPRLSRFVQRPRPSFLQGSVDDWVPIFGGRAVSASYRASRRKDRELYQASSVFWPEQTELGAKLRELDADYVYLSSALDPAGYASAFRRFEQAPSLFRPVYSEKGVSIWQVLRSRM